MACINDMNQVHTHVHILSPLSHLIIFSLPHCNIYLLTSQVANFLLMDDHFRICTPLNSFIRNQISMNINPTWISTINSWPMQLGDD